MAGFWYDSADKTNPISEPKRKFRFTVSFEGIDASYGGALLWYAKTADKPSFQISAGEHKYLNHTFHYPGSVTWQDVSISLVDPVDPDMAATLSAIIIAGGYSPPSTFDDLNSMSKASAVSALGKVTISQLNAEGNPLETWSLWNAWIAELKYGDLEYGSDDLTQLDLTLKYDWAKLEVGSDSKGAALKAGAAEGVEGMTSTEFFRP